MGYQTPSIDSIAKDGALFTDAYAQQSCTAGRSAFITGQHPVRTGLTKVGFPGSAIGLQKEDPTLADLLKNHGYATGQFGKNHLGDRNEFLPTVHGFDEFYGNLYHLNAEEEPENPDYPKDPEFRQRFGPRGVIQSTADGKVEDTGPLTIKRMETIDEETLAAAKDFIQRKQKAGGPWMCWWNWLRLPPSRPYQFFMVMEALHRLWSLQGAMPMTLVTSLKGRLKNGQVSMSFAPGVYSTSNAFESGR